MNTSTMHYLPKIDAYSLDQLLAEWQAVQPGMGVLALLPEAERKSVGLVQQACAHRRVPVVGALFPELIEGGAFRSAGAWLLRFDEMPYATIHPDLPREPETARAAMDTLAAELMPQLDGRRDTTLFLMFDAMVPKVATLLDQLYLRLANRVHYMGASPGSETFQPMPCLFDGTRIVQNGVLAILMKPHAGAILEHGYSAPTEILMATATEGNRIIDIDWRPAFEVYRELARSQYAVEIDRANFYRYAVHYPFGIMRADGTSLVRIPVSIEDDGSLFCVGEVPPSSLLTLLKAPAVDSVHTLDTLTHGLAALDGPPAGLELLLFACAGRRLHLGIEAAENELREFMQRTQATRVAGALSLGEIGSSMQAGYPLFHNATLVASRWGSA